MIKRNLIVILIVLAGIGLAVFGTSQFLMGGISFAEREFGESEIYSKAEIKSAMDVVAYHFRWSYGGCTLTELWYEENAETDDQYRSWATQYDGEDAILIYTNFDVGSGGGPGQTYEPNSTQRYVMWILVRSDDNGKWRVVDGGRG